MGGKYISRFEKDLRYEKSKKLEAAPDMLCHLSMANSKFNKKRKGFRNQDFRH
ncbi:MAG: hypothetical protein MR449_03410 [Spirochaetia bacterium]|nr:hypothetical protein [Spirochaetia bacterium]